MHSDERIRDLKNETSIPYGNDDQIKNSDGNQTDNLTKKERADVAGRDVAEMAARGAGSYFGGPLGEAAAKEALDTKIGQKTVNKVSKNLNKNPVTRNILAKNQKNISRVKPFASSLLGGGISSSSFNEEQSEVVDSHHVETSNKADNKVSGSGNISGLWKKLPLKAKLIVIGVAMSFLFLVIFIVVLVAPLMSLGIIDIGSIGSSMGNTYSPGYTIVSDNISYWWPIGSSGTTIVGNTVFASGTPVVTDITSYYASQEGFRTHVHGGIDIGNGGNGPGVINVIASKSGTVVYPTSKNQTLFEDNGYYGNPDGDGFGNFVIIEHSDGTRTIYAHLAKNSINVMAGDIVSQGQVIAKMGHSGSSTGTHLHFEVRVNGSRVDPMNYVSPSNTRPINNTSTTV